MPSTDVVIVGAGLAGLSAAQHLSRAGLSITVIDAARRIGGRMVTEETDGFRLDRGVQLLNAAYPELHSTPGLEDLRLRPFTGGVLVCGAGRRQRIGASRSTGGALTATRALTGTALPQALGFARAGEAPLPLGAVVDQARLASALARLGTVPVRELLTRPEYTAAQSLAGRGLPPRIVQRTLRPLLTALLSDPELITSSRTADLALRSFARGRLALAEGGALTLPELLAADLPREAIRTGVHAVSVCTTSVSTQEHGSLRCGAVLVATGARAAAELLPGLRLPDFHPVTVLHHSAPAPPPTEAALLLSAGEGPIAHTMVASEVDPSRAPAGRSLITSTVLGEESRKPLRVLDKEAREQLSRLYGTSAQRWELLAAHHDPEAVPVMAPPHDVHRPVRVVGGLYVCGDHRDTSSPQGALHSGRRAAHAILRDVGVRPALDPEELRPAA